MAIDFSIINRRVLVASCNVVEEVIDVDALALVVTVDTEKLEVNVPSQTAVDTGLDTTVIIGA